MSDLYPPEQPIKRKLTEKQFALLASICRTNGGGIYAPNCDQRVLKALVDRHLVQGKAGNLSSVVHTREGLELWRANQ
jgi:hypothetical protein